MFNIIKPTGEIFGKKYLTRSEIEEIVGEIEVIKVNGGVMIRNKKARELKLPINQLATAIAMTGLKIRGTVIICEEYEA